MREGQLLKEGQFELVMETLRLHADIMRNAADRRVGESTFEETRAWVDGEILRIWSKYVVFCTNAYSETLLRKRRSLRTMGDYGEANTGAWEREIRYFLAASLPEGIGVMERAGVQLVGLVDSILAEAANPPLPQSLDALSEGVGPTQYEELCAEVMRLMGYDVRLTKASGDQGVDVVARKGAVTIAMQCKLYTSPVGNKAVQEVYAGKKFIEADLAVVVSNQEFTGSARQLAQALNVFLLHHSQLQDAFGGP